MTEGVRISETSLYFNEYTRCYILDQWYSTGGTRRHPKILFLSFKTYYLIHYFGCNLFLFILNVDYTICITCIMYLQLWGYKVKEKLYLGYADKKG
jgi:hypothetical protein